MCFQSVRALELRSISWARPDRAVRVLRGSWQRRLMPDASRASDRKDSTPQLRQEAAARVAKGALGYGTVRCAWRSARAQLRKFIRAGKCPDNLLKAFLFSGQNELPGYCPDKITPFGQAWLGLTRGGSAGVKASKRIRGGTFDAPTWFFQRNPLLHSIQPWGFPRPRPNLPLGLRHSRAGFSSARRGPPKRFPAQQWRRLDRRAYP